jgi:DNA-binding XRE family transcriptional regulator
MSSTKRTRPRGVSLIGHFWSMVDRRSESECWPWRGGCWVSEPGVSHGLFSVGTRKELAHRFMLEMSVGPIGDLFACHHCDNPPCCNPKHLYAGTAKDNGRDRSERGRIPSAYDVTEKYPNEALGGYLKSNGLSCASFARKIGVSRVTVHNWANMRNRPRVALCERVLEQAGIDLRSFFSPNT